VADESGRRPVNPLVRQVDSLLRSHQDAEGEVPVLTEVFDSIDGTDSKLDPVVLETLARQLERAVLDQLGPEFNRLIEERLARALSAALETAVEELRVDLVAGVDQMVREAVASAIANTFSVKLESAAHTPSPAKPASDSTPT